MSRSGGDRQYLRNDVVVDRDEECGLLRLTHRVLVEGGRRRVYARHGDGRARRRADVREAAAVASGTGRIVRGARGNGLVVPATLVEEVVVFPEGAGNRAQAPVIRCAEAQFVLLVGVAFVLEPGGAGREARRFEVRIADWRPETLVVVRVHAARVVRIVADLLDVADEVTAGVDGLHRTDFAVE